MKNQKTIPAVTFCIFFIGALIATDHCRAAFPVKENSNAFTPLKSAIALQAGNHTDLHSYNGICENWKRLFARDASTGSESGSHEHKVRSGIFGRLSLYSGLLASIAFILTLCSIGSSFLITALTFWVYAAFFAVILGIIGLFHRKKKGMAIAGTIIGIGQFVLLIAIASFISAVASAMPGIIAAMIIFGHGA